MIVVNKFGGGVVNDAVSIKRLSEIFKDYSPDDYSVNVFSAFGKTTNTLEKIAKVCQRGNTKEGKEILGNLYSFHMDIAKGLFPQQHSVFQEIESGFKIIDDKLSMANEIDDLEFIDQILPYGEILATIIISNYFKHIKVPNKLVYATDFLQTDSNFGSANVDKQVTASNLDLEINEEILKSNKHIITQGFIGFSKKEFKNDKKSDVRFMTTLGREGSDYTAGLLGNILNVNKIILWKDVPGVMDKNPKLIGNEDAQKIDFLTYDNLDDLLQNAALGLVHPKTLNEVKEKGILLQVRPFCDFNSEGTIIA